MSTPGSISDDDLALPATKLGPDLKPISPTDIAKTLEWSEECPPGSDEPHSIVPLREELEQAWENRFPKGFDKAVDNWDELQPLCKQFSRTERWLVLSQLPLQWVARAFLCIATKKNEQLLQRRNQDKINPGQENERKRKREEAAETDLESETDAYLETSDHALSQLRTALETKQRGDDLLRRRVKKHKEDQRRWKRETVILKARLDENTDQLREEEEKVKALEAENAAESRRIGELQADLEKINTTNDALRKQQADESQEAVKMQARIAGLEMDASRWAKADLENDRLRKDVQIKDDTLAGLRETSRVLQDQYDRAQVELDRKEAVINRLQREKRALEEEKRVLEKNRIAQDEAHKRAVDATTKVLRESEEKCKKLESEQQLMREGVEAGIEQALKAVGQRSSPGLRTPASKKKPRCSGAVQAR